MSKLNKFKNFEIEGLEKVNGGLSSLGSCVYTCCDKKNEDGSVDILSCSDIESDPAA